MRSKLFPFVVLLLLFVTCAWIVLYRVQPGPREHLGICFLLGSLYGHSTLASGWIAFGPFKWHRLPLALAWLSAVPTAYFINTMFYIKGPEVWLIWASGGIFLLLVQMFAWPLRFWWSLRISKPVQERNAGAPPIGSHQFGIQELMILTTVVAVIIGGGRLMLPYLLSWLATLDVAILVFLAVVAIIVCFPLVFSILAMRKPVIPTIFMLVLAAFATYIELPIISSLGMPAGGPDRLHLILINTFSLLPVVIVCSALRLAGFQLLSPRN